MRTGWRLCLAVLGAAASGIAVVGLLDFLRAEGIAGRATGGALVALGGFTFAAVTAAWPSASARGWLRGAVAAAALLLVSGLVIGAVFPARQPHLVRVIVVCSVVAGFSVVTLILAWFLRRRCQGDARGSAERGGGKREVVGAMATLFAALIAVPLAWYSAYYVPVHVPPSVSIKTELGEMVERGGRGVASLMITVTNTGSASARLIGSMYVVSGTRVSGSGRSGTELDEEKARAAAEHNHGPGARYSATVAYDHPTVVQFGQVTLDQTVLMPNESTEVAVVVFFPAKTYDVLRVGTDVIIARDDRLPTGASHLATGADAVTTTNSTCADRRVLTQVWPLQHASLVEELTQDDREVVLGRVIQDPDRSDTPWWPAVPYLTYQVQRKGHPCDHLFSDDSGGLESASMAGTAGAMAERLVPAELAPPSG